jgi:hypothetical protein
MKKSLLLALLVCLTATAFAQYESVGPITQMYTGIPVKKVTRSTNPIDSSFVYLSDTLTLPLVDDFSKSKYQAYDAEPTDPNVTEELFYMLLDPANGDAPFAAGTVFSQTQTFRYIYENSDTDTILLAGIPVKIGDFTEYPIVYTTVTVYPAYNIRDTLDFPNDPDTVLVPTPEYLQDSARIFTALIDDPGAIWVDHHTYRNYTFAVNPWSLGVATFDGLDETGYPYNFGSTAHGVADFLTTKPLDLSALGPADSVYLTFMVQPQGYGDVSEANDSLVLEFYDAVADQWNRIWGMQGSSLTEFERTHIRISQAAYFTDGFRFRFKNYGELSGALDQFHLDCVFLRAQSGYEDSVIRDLSWSYPVGSLLKEYTQVPWDHFKDNPNGHTNDEVKLVVHNGWPISNNNNLGGTTRVNHNGVLQHEFTMAGSQMSNGALDYAPFTTYVSLHDFSGSYDFDETIPGEAVTFDIIGRVAGQLNDGVQHSDFILNDSCFSQQYFGNVYAYDDGSAEAAWGPTSAQALLAVQFEPYVTNDSLVAVQMHFVPSVNDVSNNLFLLSVWSDNNGNPGTLLYEDDFFNARTPSYAEGHNGFTTYYLRNDNDPDHALRLPITGTFHVGWRQIDAPRLNIGLDWNNDHNERTKYSVNGGAHWYNSSYNASVMMRPLFATTGMSDLAVGEQEQQPEWEVYPNPTQGSVTISWRNDAPFPGAICVDAQGRTVGVAEAGQPTIDLSEVPAGIYFIQLSGFGQQVKKVIRY